MAAITEIPGYSKAAYFIDFDYILGDESRDLSTLSFKEWGNFLYGPYGLHAAYREALEEAEAMEEDLDCNFDDYDSEDVEDLCTKVVPFIYAVEELAPKGLTSYRWE